MTNNSISSTNESSNIIVAVLIGISAIYPLGMNIFVPSMPAMVEYFQSTPGMVQLTLSLYLFASAVAMLIVGPVSDKLGRRPVLLAGLLFFLVGSIICSSALSLTHLLIGRTIQAVGGAASMTMSRAIIRDLYTRDKAASMMGYVTMGMAVAPMLGPLIGGMLHESFGWRSIFYLLSILGLLILGATWTYLPETKKTEGAVQKLTKNFSSYGILFKRVEFLSFSTTNLFCSGVFFSFLGGAPFIAEELLGMSPREYGQYFILVAAGYMTGNFLTGRFSIRYGIMTLITWGNSIALTGVATIALFFLLGYLHPISLFGPMFFIGMANGLTLPNVMAGIVSVRPDLAGAASGLGSSMQITAGSCATVLVGWLLGGILWPGTIWPLLMCMGIFGFLTLLMGLVTLGVEQRKVHD